MGTDVSTVMSSRSPGTSANQTAIRAARAASVSNRPQLPTLSKSDGQLVAFSGDCVSSITESVPNTKFLEVSRLIHSWGPDQYVCLGDNTYLQGLYDSYSTNYDSSYGRLKARTWPVAGNHEMQGCLFPFVTPPTVVSGITTGATSVTLTAPLTNAVAGDTITFDPSNPETTVGTVSKTILTVSGSTYTFSALGASISVATGATAYTVNRGHGFVDYFGQAAGSPFTFYRAYNLGRYRFYVIDSNSAAKVASGSTQMNWLAADIAANPKRPILAAYHHPRWTNGSTMSSDSNLEFLVQTLWNTGRCQAIFNGHDHNYQRASQIKPNGAGNEAIDDLTTGFTQLIVGTGGYNNFGVSSGGIQDFIAGASGAPVYGALRCQFGAQGWAYQFVQLDVNGITGTVIDEGYFPLFGV